MHCKELPTYLRTVQTLLFTGTKARAKNTLAAISIHHCSSLLLARFNHCRVLCNLFLNGFTDLGCAYSGLCYCTPQH